MKFEKVALLAMAAAISVPTLAIAEDEEHEFEEAFVFFELNDTDGDLGIHGKVDGDEWKKVAIEGPDDSKILDVKAKAGARLQGLTELFFESAEPTFDELDPYVFFDRFPEGEYEWEGLTLDGEEIEGEVFLSHIIPAAPVVAAVGSETENPGFEEDDGEIPPPDGVVEVGIEETAEEASIRDLGQEIRVRQILDGPTVPIPTPGQSVESDGKSQVGEGQSRCRRGQGLPEPACDQVDRQEGDGPQADSGECAWTASEPDGEDQGQQQHRNRE